jgi:DNA primase
LNRAVPLLDYQLEALRKKFDLRNEQARLPFVREAVRTIAQSGSHLVRQEYGAKLSAVLDRLAEEWYPGDPHRAMQARVALKDEINRHLLADRMNGRKAPQPAPVRPAAPLKASGRSLAERYVLRAALTEYRWAEYVAGAARLEYFSEGELKGIALRLLGNNPAEEGWSPEQRAESVRLDPTAAELVSALLLDDSPLTDEGLERCLQELDREYKQDRKGELQRAIKAGEIGPGDPDWDEYLQLLAELGGKRRED